MFIQIPSITRYEWHPFTISSAPETKDVFWLHIIGVGSWTNEHFNNTYESAGDNNSKEGIHVHVV